MSKESYTRGFCKAAEAHGVDPVALAKYAAKLETGGMAPSSVVNIGTNAVPAYVPGPLKKEIDTAYFSNGRSKALRTPYEILQGAQLNQNVGDDIDGLVASNKKIAPSWFNNWLNAHRIANDAVAGSFADWIRGHKNPDGSFKNEAILERMSNDPKFGKAMVNSYHSIMNKLTNSAPAQASSPARVPVSKK